MLTAYRPSQPRWVFSSAAFFVLIMQVALALAPLGDARHGRSAAAHVERGHTATHYAHNDATCASCQARTLHGIAARAAAGLPERARYSTAFIAAAEQILSPEFFSPNSPRAPPSRELSA